MTDLLPDTVEDRIVPTPPHPMPAVSPRRPQPAARKRGRWTPVIVLLVTDWAVAMFLIGTVLFPDPVPVDGDSAPSSTVPSPVTVPPVTGGGEPVAAHADGSRREGGGPDGDVPQGVTTSTTVAPVVPDAAPARGQTPSTGGPAGGPASTTTTTAAATTTTMAQAPPVVPPTPDPGPPAPEPPTEPPVDPAPPETTPSTETAP
jgi:hypothetical protein